MVREILMHAWLKFLFIFGVIGVPLWAFLLYLCERMGL